MATRYNTYGGRGRVGRGGLHRGMGWEIRRAGWVVGVKCCVKSHRVSNGRG